MKTVFNANAQVAHIWAQRAQNYGRTSNNNIFFDDDVIYSYGRHFELGKFVEYEGKVFLFLNTAKYSVTTSKHQRLVFRAVNTSVIDYQLRFEFKRNRFYLGKEYIFELCEDFHRKAQLWFNTQLKAISIYSSHDKGVEYYNNIIFFKHHFRELLGINYVSKLDSLLESLNEIKEQSRQKSEHLYTIEEEKRKRNRFRKQEKEEENLKKWLLGDYNGTLYNLPIHFRLINEGKTLQTTRGANVPLKEALQAWKELKLGNNIRGKKIGNFTVIDKTDEIIKIGCHTIELKTAEAFFKSLEHAEGDLASN